MIFLDEPSGALNWTDILLKAEGIIDYCEAFDVPTSHNLTKENLDESLGRALDILISNKKVDVIGNPGKDNQKF